MAQTAQTEKIEENERNAPKAPALFSFSKEGAARRRRVFCYQHQIPKNTRHAGAGRVIVALHDLMRHPLCQCQRGLLIPPRLNLL